MAHDSDRRSSQSPSRPDHRRLAEALRRRVLEQPGETDVAFRRAAAARAAGGAPLNPPYDDLARQIGACAAQTTDMQVAKVVEAIGSQRAAFEFIIAAALGAGLARWDAGLRALEGAADETQ
jgi:hypothetical protein